jgi:hypothetical protein
MEILEFPPFVSQIKAKTYEIENLEKVYLLILLMEGLLIDIT